MGSGELVFSGADAGRGGTGILLTEFWGKGGGCDCCCCNCCGRENGEFAFGCWVGLNELAGLNCTCCCCSGVWPKTGNGLVPWLAGEGPNGEGFVGGGSNGKPSRLWMRPVRSIQGVVTERIDGSHLWKYRSSCWLILKVLAEWVTRRLC